jgi:pimeloyl-ACP methyl ester carboxylesterase
VPGPSRRAVLLGGIGLAAAAGLGGGYELVQDGTLPGKYTLARLDGACGSAPPAPTGRLPARHVVTFYSAYRRRAVQMVTLVPAGAGSGRGLGVVVALHGSGGTAASMATQVEPAMTTAAVTSFAVICVDGGDTYWHERTDGDDPVGMILHEVLPRAAATGLAVGRIGLTGESMGGYGALLLAERLAAPAGAALDALIPEGKQAAPPALAGAQTGPDLPAAAAGPPPAVAAAAALSPAIFASYADARTANGAAFDSPADFARNNVFADLHSLRRVPTWIACGADDPFQPETALLRARLGAITGHQVPGGIWSGCHDDAFWERNMPAGLQFIAAHLT